MSTPDAGHAARAIACPRCASPVLPEQDWCLVCGAAARTRLAPPPNWKLPLVALGTIVALSLVVLALAFVALTDDPAPATGATGASGATGAAAPAPAPTPTPAPAPAPTGPTGPTAVAPTPAPAGATGATGATGKGKPKPATGATTGG